MKALYCQDCRDLVVSWKQTPRSCFCGRHIIWGVAEPPHAVNVHDRKGQKDRAFILRFSTEILMIGGPTDAGKIQEMLANCPPTLREQNSLIARSDIGSAPDIEWNDTLPPIKTGYTRNGPKIIP